MEARQPNKNFDFYLYELYKQYCSSEGIKPLGKEKAKTSLELIGWIAYSKLLLKEYADYLRYIRYDLSDAVEIGKGRYDTLPLPELSKISEYASTFDQKNSTYGIVNGTLYCLNENGIYVPEQSKIITHNPYSERSVTNWSEVHNNGEKDIGIGMFGNVHDKDYKSKLRFLESIKDRTEDDVEIEYDTDNDKYFCLLHSKRKTLR